MEFYPWGLIPLITGMVLSLSDVAQPLGFALVGIGAAHLLLLAVVLGSFRAFGKFLTGGKH